MSELSQTGKRISAKEHLYKILTNVPLNQGDFPYSLHKKTEYSAAAHGSALCCPNVSPCNPRSFHPLSIKLERDDD